MVISPEIFSENYILVLIILLLGFSLIFTKQKYKELKYIDKIFSSAGVGVIALLLIIIILAFISVLFGMEEYIDSLFDGSSLFIFLIALLISGGLITKYFFKRGE